MSGGNNVHIQEREQNNLVAVFQTLFEENGEPSHPHLFSRVTATNIRAAPQLAAFPFTHWNAGLRGLFIVERLGLSPAAFECWGWINTSYIECFIQKISAWRICLFSVESFELNIEKSVFSFLSFHLLLHGALTFSLSRPCAHACRVWDCLAFLCLLACSNYEENVFFFFSSSAWMFLPFFGVYYGLFFIMDFFFTLVFRFYNQILEIFGRSLQSDKSVFMMLTGALTLVWQRMVL